MTNKMLKFTDLQQETPKKRSTKKEQVISTKFIMSLLLIKPQSNQADVLSVEFHFVKYTAL